MRITKESAYTMLEMSLVVIVVGVLFSGIFSGIKMVEVARISKARSLSSTSPVLQTAELALWYDTTSLKSFSSVQPANNEQIAIWKDINTQSNIKRNATSSGSNRPTYVKKALNGLPVLRFDGVSNDMDFDGTFVAGTDYTIFIVEQRRSSVSGSYFWGCSGTIVNSSCMVLGYRSSTIITQAHFSNDIDMTISGYTSPIPAISTFVHDDAFGGNGRKYYRNGVFISSSGGSAPNANHLLASPGGKLGNFSGSRYSGDIAEIIAFTRALNDFERQDIEQYLAKKWGIKYGVVS